jgi:hypothetical protein
MTLTATILAGNTVSGSMAGKVARRVLKPAAKRAGVDWAAFHRCGTPMTGGHTPT